MIFKGYKTIVEDFNAKKCERDPPCLPNQAIPQTQHEQIFTEVNSLVSYYKQLEYEIKEALDTPIRIMYLFRAAKNYLIGTWYRQNKNNVNMQSEDYREVLKSILSMT